MTDALHKPRKGAARHPMHKSVPSLRKRKEIPVQVSASPISRNGSNVGWLLRISAGPGLADPIVIVELTNEQFGKALGHQLAEGTAEVYER